ncbi:unnamed protein product [Rhizopus stolonifer]
MESELALEENTPLLFSGQIKPNKPLEEKPSIWYIIAPVFVIAFSYAASMAPTIEALSLIFCYKYYLAQDNNADNIPWDHCNIPEVQALVSRAQSIITFLAYGSTLLLAGYYGSLSDRKGRRFVLVISIFGAILPYAALVLTLQYFSLFNIYLLFAFNIFRGFLAGDSVLVATANAYLTDCTTPSSRTLAFSYFGSSIFVGAAIGPLVSSFIIKQTDSIFSVFYLIIAIHIVLIIYTAFFLPESNDISKYKENTNRTLLQNINVFSAIGVFFRPPLKHANRWALPLLALVQMLLNVVALPPTLLYAMLKFNWTAYEGGLFISFNSTINVFSFLVILPALTKVLSKIISVSKNPKSPFKDAESSKTSRSSSSTSIGIEEVKSEQDIRNPILIDVIIVRMGLFFKSVSFVALGLVTSSTGFVLAGALESISVLYNPSIRSLITSLVDPSHIGELWGAMATLEACAMIISQFLINYIYSETVSTMPALVFFCCAGVVGIATILVFFIYPAEKEFDQEV